MKMYSKEGNTMMDMQSLRREGCDLVVKGKMMDAMLMSIYLRPEDMWKSKSLLSWSVIWYLPVILVKGWWRNLRKEKEEKNETKG